MMFNLFFSKHAKRFLKNLDKSLARRIHDKINSLNENSVIFESKKLEGRGLYRIRVGEFRIVYEIDYNKRFIVLLK